MIKNSTVLAMIIALALVFTSCNNKEVEYVDDGATNIDFTNRGDTDVNPAEHSSSSYIGQQSQRETTNTLGAYIYPENPAEQLKSALESDALKRELPMKIGGVEKVEFDNQECSQFKINFTGGSENMCIITFVNKNMHGYSESLDGYDNPSFTIAFKDPDNSQDMVTVLTSVIKYLSPDLSFEEAKRLATKQDETISTDGYSMPQDISGYQIQARYTNPHVFVRTPDFEAKLGVKVRAIKQMWGTLNTQQCQELKTSEDYYLLTKEYPYLEESEEPAIVYADFIVKNVWQDQSYIHGETWVVVDIESMTGQQYSISLDTWTFPNTYEFGVGQQYTLYIGLNYISGVSGGIIYAVQQTESAQLNSRGEVQPIDYPTVDWRNPVGRIEPEVEGTVYDVSFLLESQSYGEQFAALEGHGIGEKQWPNNPVWDGYTFVGWYDNLEWKGDSYTEDTPIYQETSLYAKWKYSGSGGIWPRAHRGNVQGIDEGVHLSVGQKVSITASGYNMNLESPKDQRFRWKPMTWRLSDGTSSNFSNVAPFQTVLSLESKGEQRLYITYLEEIFDGIDWQETGQLHEVEEVMLRIDG